MTLITFNEFCNFEPYIVTMSSIYKEIFNIKENARFVSVK